MRMKLTALSLIAAGFVTVGCGRLTSDGALTGIAQAPHRGGIRMMLESDQEPAQFDEIGIVRATGEGNRANLESVFEGLQREAQRMGANAVIRIRIDQTSNVVAGIGVAVRLP